MNFNRINAFPVIANMAEASDLLRNSSGDCMAPAYSNSPLGVVGLVDIADPANPKPMGAINVGGKPQFAASHSARC